MKVPGRKHTTGPVQALGASVDIWQVDLAVTGDDLECLENSLSPDEHRRASSYVFAQHRRNFIVARAALREILGGYLKCLAREIVFTYGVHGKPRLASLHSGSQLEFNLSHSGMRALIAVASGFAVGVDIEEIQPAFATFDMAEIAFSQNERDALARLPQKQRVAAFFKCWTSKEAYIKGLGKGLAIPLSEFDVCVLPDVPARLVRPYADAQDQNIWSLRGLDAGQGYAAALAVSEIPTSIVVRPWIFRPNDLRCPV